MLSSFLRAKQMRCENQFEGEEILGYKKALCFYPYLEFRSEVEVVGTTWRWEYLAGRLLLEWAGAWHCDIFSRCYWAFYHFCALSSTFQTPLLDFGKFLVDPFAMCLFGLWVSLFRRLYIPSNRDKGTWRCTLADRLIYRSILHHKPMQNLFPDLEAPTSSTRSPNFHNILAHRPLEQSPSYVLHQ